MPGKNEFMNYGRSLVLLATSFLALSWLAGCTSSDNTEKTPEPPIELHLVHTPEVEPLAREMAERFHALKPTLSGGAPIRLALIPLPLMQSAQRIARGKVKTDLWLAPSRSALNLVNSTLTNLGPKQIDCEVSFSTPTVVVVKNDFLGDWTPIEEGVISISDLIGKRSLLLQSKTQKYHGLTQFRLVHANPTSSTAGVAALMNLTYLSLNADEPAAVDLRSLPKEQIFHALQTIEGHALRYGPNDLGLLRQMVSAERPRPHFLVTTRQQFKRFLNIEPLAASEISAFLVKEGTYIQDYSLCRSDADWVTSAKQTAIKKFAEFFNATSQSALKEQYGFDLPKSLQPYSADTVGEVKAPAIPVPVLPNTSDTLLGDIVELWRKAKRPLAITVVLDLSGSMQERGLAIAQGVIESVIEPISSKDLVALLTFSSEVELASSFKDTRKAFKKALRSLTASGGSALYDAVRQGVDLMTIREKPGNRRLIVLFITDGKDKNSRITMDAMRSSLSRRSESDDLTVIGIGFKNEETDHAALKAAVLAAGGTFFHTTFEDAISAIAHIQKTL
jgi:Mg-chelatase subunit ChlD